jgi:6-phosphogluconate dehydrogenase
MVHNGIEYGDMQLIAEVYDVMKGLLGMSNEEMAGVFEDWNEGELSSYLIEITTKILRKKDDKTGEGFVVDYILDKTGMKGTGTWTIQEGAARGVAVSTMASALDARMLSGRKDERVAASAIFSSPAASAVDKTEVLADLRAALYASKLCSYAQGLSLIKAASDEYSWDVSLAECARLWTGGCIIRAKLLDDIQKAFVENPTLPNLLVDPTVSAAVDSRTSAWRRLVALTVTNGIPVPALSNSLSYFDSYRRARLPANLTQAQRDFFGGHTYERIDGDGHYHTAWTDAHKDIGDVATRTAGEKLLTN